MFARGGRERVAKRAKKGRGVTRKRVDKHLEREHPSIYSWEPQSARLESLSDYCIRLRLRSVKQKCRLGENSAPTVCLHATRPRGFTLYSLGRISVTVAREYKVQFAISGIEDSWEDSWGMERIREMTRGGLRNTKIRNTRARNFS